MIQSINVLSRSAVIFPSRRRRRRRPLLEGAIGTSHAANVTLLRIEIGVKATVIILYLHQKIYEL